MTETSSNDATVNPELTLKRFALRSLLPVAAVVLVLSTFVIGPSGFAVAAGAWWLVQTRY